MNIYVWYTGALEVSGITCAETKELAAKKAEDYLSEVFPWDADELYDRGYKDLELSIWPIEEDEVYVSKYPTTIAMNY